MGLPSMRSETDVSSTAASLANIEPPGAEGADAVGVEPASADHRGQRKCVIGGECNAGVAAHEKGAGASLGLVVDRKAVVRHHTDSAPGAHHVEAGEDREHADRDRKSTRLNSSHLGISYAVF